MEVVCAERMSGRSMSSAPVLVPAILSMQAKCRERKGVMVDAEKRASKLECDRKSMRSESGGEGWPKKKSLGGE